MDDLKQNSYRSTEEKKSDFSRKGKMRLILSRFFIIILVILSAILYIQKNSEQTKRRIAEKTLQEISAAKELLDKELDETTNLMKEISDHLTETRNELELQLKEKEMLKEELLKISNLIKEISEQLNGTRKELELRLKEKEMLTEEKRKIEENLNQMKEEKIRLEENLSQIKEAKEALENKVIDLIFKKEIELEKILVSPRTKIKTEKGEVLSVNREYNFIIINLGAKDGIKQGFIFNILRDNNPIGRAKIQKVYPDTSVGEILFEEQKGGIREGDTVVRSF